MANRYCMNCGKLLDGHHVTFCSRSCEANWYASPHAVQCRKCGETVMMTGRFKTCQHCRDAAYFKKNAQRNPKYHRRGSKYSDRLEPTETNEQYFKKRYKNAGKGLTAYAKQDAENRKQGKPHVSYGMYMAMKAAELKEEKSKK